MGSSAADVKRQRYLKYWCEHGVKRGKCVLCDGTSGYLYFTGGGTSYHASPECPSLVKGQQHVAQRGGSPEQIEAVRSARSAAPRRACRTCRPDEAQVARPRAKQSPSPPARAAAPAPVRRRAPHPTAEDSTIEAASSGSFGGDAIALVGEVGLFDLGGWERMAGQTCRGVQSEGDAWRFRVVGPAIDLELVDVTWDNGERDLRVVKVDVGSAHVERLARGLRVSVVQERRGVLSMLLRIPRLSPGASQTTAQRTDLRELSKVLGLDVVQFFRSAGAEAVGERRTVVGDTGRNRLQLCVTWRDPDNTSPLSAQAFLLTPVLTSLYLEGSVNAPAAPSGSAPRSSVDGADRDRLLQFLWGSVCAPCREIPPEDRHARCNEAAELHELVAGW